MNVKSNAISFVTLKTVQVLYLLIERCIQVYEIYESFQGCFYNNGYVLIGVKRFVIFLINTMEIKF